MKTPVFRIIAAILAAVIFLVILAFREPDLKLLTAFLFYILAVVFWVK